MKKIILIILSVIVIGSCEKKVKDPVIADFEIIGNDHKAGDTIQFINTSVNAIRYEWNFHDGSGSFEKNPMHVFTEERHDIVSLVCYNDYFKDYKIDSIMILKSERLCFEADNENDY